MDWKNNSVVSTRSEGGQVLLDGSLNVAPKPESMAESRKSNLSHVPSLIIVTNYKTHWAQTCVQEVVPSTEVSMRRRYLYC